MRRAAALLAVLALAGCGADEEQTPTDFPAVTVRGGVAHAKAPDQQAAKRLCDGAQQDWPARWGEHPYVTLDLADGEQYSCVRPGG